MVTNFSSTRIAPELIAAHKTVPAPFFPVDGLHREQVIVDVADLEAIALAAIRRFVRSLRSEDQIDDVDAALRAADLQDDTSLTRLCAILFLLNLIDADIHHDLKKLYQLRKLYAHRAIVGQLGTDPETTKHLHDFVCYKVNRAALAVLDSDGKVYRAITAHLRNGLYELTQ